MKPVKIVSYNTYLICNKFNKNRVTHPEQRASKICRDFLSLANDQHSRGKTKDLNKLIKPDLCFFQEVWGSGIQDLTKTSDYSSPPRRISLFSATYKSNEIEYLGFGSFLDTIKELVDTFYFHWQRTGGLYDFSYPSMTCLYRNKHTFAVSRSKSHKGVEATLWDVPQWRNDPTGNCNSNIKQNPKRLLVFNTHLDPWHAANRRTQICEILQFIEETLQSIEKIDALTTENEEDYPRFLNRGQEREHNKYNWSRTGVLVVGDFNIKAGSKEYWETLGFLESLSEASNGNFRWKDFFFFPGETEDDNQDQHTYSLQNSLVEYPNDCGRIDYIFGIQHFGNILESMDSRIPQQQKCPRMFMPLNMVSRSIRKEPIGAECSDHYALVLEVIPAL